MNLEAIIPASEKELSPSRGHAEAIVVDLFKKPVEVALDAVVQGRAERSAEREKREIAQKLQNLQLAKELREKLYPQLPPSVGTFEERSIDHPYGTRKYAYTAVPYDDTEIALLQLPPIVFETDEDESELYISDFVYMLMAFRGRSTRLFSEGLPGPPTYAFDSAISSEGRDWRIIQWSNIVALGKAKLTFWKAFWLPMPTPVPARAATPPREVNQEQLTQIKGVLVTLARDYPSSGEAFRFLVDDSNWPMEWKDQRRSGWANSAPVDASTFVDYMVVKGTFPTGDDRAGKSVLGEFLCRLLETKKTLGGEDTAKLAKIMVECALVPDSDTFKRYYLLK